MHRKVKTVIAILALTATMVLISACSGQDSREFREISDELQQETASMRVLLDHLQVENQSLSARLSEAEALLARLPLTDLFAHEVSAWPTEDAATEEDSTYEPEPPAEPTSEDYSDEPAEYHAADEPSYTPDTYVPVLAAAAVNIIDMPVVAMSPENYNSWIPFGEIRTWDISRRDSTGYARLSGGILAGRVDANDGEGVLDSVAHTGHRHSVTYSLNSQYSRFRGTITLYWGNNDAQRDYQIVFVGDEERIFESPIITGGSQPIDFDVDVSGINQIRIGRLSPDGGAAIIGIVDAYFIP
ncbi:MAG: NPCBM/NEW2 domain-containing protein [Firmicutes bacterium]|nr:NPCBM/NEW2 domain-containing protein [Bacillota bacterium]